VATDRYFAQVVSLACHDLRTPLATVHGFARTIERLDPQDERTRSYVGLISAGSAQMTQLLERLALAARIERAAYEPVLERVDSLELARAAADEVDVGEIAVSGEGVPLQVDREHTLRSLADFCVCAIRHGEAERLECNVRGAEMSLTPVTEESGPILLGEDLRDFGAAVARIHVEALGGSVAVQGEELRIELPTSAAGTSAGP
jgi:signal transduction histidine kinase